MPQTKAEVQSQPKNSAKNTGDNENQEPRIYGNSIKALRKWYINNYIKLNSGNLSIADTAKAQKRVNDLAAEMNRRGIALPDMSKQNGSTTGNGYFDFDTTTILLIAGGAFLLFYLMRQ